MSRTRNNKVKFSQKPRNRESRNYQDQSEVQEYDKGYRAGENKRKKPKWATPTKSRNGQNSNAIIRGEKEGNDISWHNPNQNMFDGATGVTFNASVGLPIKVGPDASKSIPNWHGEDASNPGIMVMHWAPSLGKASNPNDPVNEATISLFQYLRRNKSGSEIYQPADVGMVIGALDSAYVFYEFCCKVYGLARNVDIMNTYVPQTMLAAHSVNAKSIVDNLADFHFWLSDFAMQLRGFYVPKGIHLFDRHTYMARQVFTDSETDKAQYYAYVPTHYLQFVEGTQASPMSSLQYTMLINVATMGSANPSNWLTVQQLMDFGDSLISPLKQSESVRNILADMLTAFPDNGSYSIGDIPTDYVVKPIYDQQALMMFENSFTYGYGNTLEGGYSQQTAINASYMVETTAITPNVNIVSAQVDTWQTIQRVRNLLNFHMSNPSKEDIMYATRLAGFGFNGPKDEDGSVKDSQLLKTHGSEIATDWTVWYYGLTSAGRVTYSFTMQTYTFNQLAKSMSYEGIINSFLKTELQHLAIWSKFDWHPKVYQVNFTTQAVDNSTITALEVSDAFYDMDVFAPITEQQLEQMNRVSLLGLLICRDMGAYSKEIMD